MNTSILSDLKCPSTSGATACEGSILLSDQAMRPLFLRDDESEVVEGIAICEECQAEYPIICGVLILLPNVETYLAEHYSEITSAACLDPVSRTMLAYIQKRGYDLHDAGYTSASGDSGVGLISRYIEANYDSLGARLDKGRPLIDLLTAYTEKDFYTQIAELALPTLSEHSRVLDVGCNVGGLSWRLARNCRSAYGIDLSFRAVLTGRQILIGSPRPLTRYRAYREGLRYEERPLDIDRQNRIEMIVASCLNLPFRAMSFNLVSCVNILAAVCRPSELLDEATRVLKAKGILLVSDPYVWQPDRTEIDNWIRAAPEQSASAAVRGCVEHACDLLEERDGIPWLFRISDRYYHIYLGHCLLFKKRSA